MEQNKITDNESAESIRLLEEKVNALRTTIMEQKTPWYKNIATIISILAFLLSFGTTYFSYTRAKAQDIQSTKVELRGLLQRLSALPKEYYEIRMKYQQDQNAIGTLQGTISQENSLLATQAAELARRLPRNSVSSTEWQAIAIAMDTNFNFEAAKEFMGYAIEASKGFNEKIAALRGNANLLFEMGQSPSGRVEFQRSLNIFSEFEGYDENTRNKTHLQTYLAWAFAEARSGYIEDARQCLVKAEGYASKLLPGPDADDLWKQVVGMKKQLSANKRMINPPIGASGGTQDSFVPKTAPASDAPPRIQNKNSSYHKTPQSQHNKTSHRGHPPKRHR
jgi:tetratricopeptide (TPR) repeat protein